MGRDRGEDEGVALVALGGGLAGCVFDLNTRVTASPADVGVEPLHEALHEIDLMRALAESVAFAGIQHQLGGDPGVSQGAIQLFGLLGRHPGVVEAVDEQGGGMVLTFYNHIGAPTD